MAVVFVAKENTEFIALLRLHLESYGHDVHTAYSAHEVRQRLPTSGADVVLLGLALRNELSLTELRGLCPGTKVVLYSVDEPRTGLSQRGDAVEADAALSTLADFEQLQELMETLVEATD